MSAAFVPTFTRRLTLDGKDQAWRLGNNLINALILVTGLLVLAGMIFATPLVTAYARNFSSVPGKLEELAGQVLDNKSVKSAHIYFNNTAGPAALANARWLINRVQ